MHRVMVHIDVKLISFNNTFILRTLLRLYYTAPYIKNCKLYKSLDNSFNEVPTHILHDFEVN